MSKVKVKLFYNKSAVENANYYFELSKKFAKKADGALKAVEMLKGKNAKQEKKKAIPTWKPKEWYEAYPHFYTSEGRLLCIAGRNAGENELLYRRHLEDDDLFFHAHIQGAATVILKKGLDASLEDKLEAASFAASYSKGWSIGESSVDVYCVKKEQIYKTIQKAGTYDIKGEREWFKNSAVRLKAGLKEGKPTVVPYRYRGQLEKPMELRPGRMKKDEAATKIAKTLAADESYIKSLLPSGSFSISKVD